MHAVSKFFRGKGSKKDSDKQRFYLAVHCMIKDDAQYMDEWFEYYRSIGVQHFYVYDNNSAIPVLFPYADVTVVPWIMNDPLQQHKSILNCCNAYSQWRWIGFLDSDEYVILQRDQSLSDLLREYEFFDGVAFNWLMYGTSGLKTRPKSINSFTRHAPRDHISNTHVKSFINPRSLKTMPTNPHYLGVQTVGEDFVLMDSPFRTFSNKVAFVKHLFTRSEEDYLHKGRRGHSADINNVNNYYSPTRLYGELEIFNLCEEPFGSIVNYDGWWSDHSNHCHSPQLAENLIALLQNSSHEYIWDFGCGDGYYLSRLKEAGFKKLSGIEGAPSTQALFQTIISANLAERIELPHKGIVMSFEVGEHIRKEQEQNFIDNIARHATRTAIVSWAVIGQDGIGHINCQNNEYIISEFAKRGFSFDSNQTAKLRTGIEDNCAYFRNTLMVFNNIN
jgi:hypothetical protein